MAKRDAFMSRKRVHHMTGPRKATLTDVGWGLDRRRVGRSRAAAPREVQFSDQPGQ